MTEFMTDLLITSLAMSVVIVALAGLNKVCGSSISASFKRTIWIVVLFGLLIPFRPSIPMPFEPIAIPMPFESETESKTAEFFTEANIEGEAAFESNASVSRPSPDAVQSPPFIESRSIPYGFVLFAVWCVIAIGIFGFHLWSYKRFLSSIRRWSGDTEDTHLLHILQSVQGSMKIPGKPFSVKTCSLVDSPMLIGFLHPQIILPVVHISDDELECVLRHELTHYRRGDLWVNLIILFVLSM
ncbi:MAG: hypothetical protein LBS21_03910, partial [Clostridiales bacterium]|nr:hypothetical protein [Clostridiales bacterium]